MESSLAHTFGSISTTQQPLRWARWWPCLKLELLVRHGSYYFSHLHLHAQCAVTALAAGRVGDIIGRKGTLFSGAVVFTIGGAIQTWSTGYYLMIIGRIVSGLGVGLLSYVLSPECRHIILIL